MSKDCQIANEHLHSTSNNALSWEGAIAEAERQITANETRNRQLRLAISGFEDMRDHGEVFPVERELLGQDSDL